MLGLVPARGGSRGLPGKNLRALDGKPLVLRALDTLAQVPEITRIVCSTDDPTIAAVARIHGYEVLDRPAHLADDDTTIDEVAAHVTVTLGWDGPICVLQPTVPFVTAEQISEASHKQGCESVGFVTPENHLLWENGKALYRERVNRQQLSGIFREIGCFLTNRAGPTDPLVSDRHGIYNVANGTDIDTVEDLHAARLRIRFDTTIRFVIHASERNGSGHLRRCQALASELDHHNIELTLTPDSEDWARAIAADRPHAQPAVIVFDKLDTTREEVAAAKAAGARVLTLEDLGPGGELADVVVNELYAGGMGHVLSGPKYAVLRPEFMACPPFLVREIADRVLVTFGGTDPAGMVERVTSLTWPAVDMFTIKPDECMAERMLAADLIVTSCGRTVHEAAALGVPVVAIAVNERETRHFPCPGTIRLGLAHTVSNRQIQATIHNVLNDQHLREEMSQQACRAIDGKGARRIAHLIEGLVEGL